MKVGTAAEAVAGIKKMTIIMAAVHKMESFIKEVCSIVCGTEEETRDQGESIEVMPQSKWTQSRA